MSSIQRITCYIRPHRLEAVKSAIASLGVTGLTAADVRGTGNSVDRSPWEGAFKDVVALPIRAKLEVVVTQDMTENVVQAILDHAWTGEPDDGKIFVEPIADAIRIRTEERGAEAV